MGSPTVSAARVAEGDPIPFSTVSVAVIGMSGERYLARCLEALGSQRDAPDFATTVVCDPRLRGIEPLRRRFPHVRIIVNDGQRTTLELASRALRECTGELILMTKDHCVPAPRWVRTMLDAQRRGRAAVGGRVEIASAASRVDWAHHFIDFFRYGAPATTGPVSSLTVCNVAYKRRELDAVRDLWHDRFVETVVNDGLRDRFGSLWLDVASEVTVERHVSLREALSERYVSGRVFACSRLAHWSPRRRLLYALLAPALPLVLVARMARVALRDRRQAQAFLRSVVPLTLIVMARSGGEWIAYLTGRPGRTPR